MLASELGRELQWSECGACLAKADARKRRMESRAETGVWGRLGRLQCALQAQAQVIPVAARTIRWQGRVSLHHTCWGTWTPHTERVRLGPFLCLHKLTQGVKRPTFKSENCEALGRKQGDPCGSGLECLLGHDSGAQTTRGGRGQLGRHRVGLWPSEENGETTPEEGSIRQSVSAGPRSPGHRNMSCC